MGAEGGVLEGEDVVGEPSLVVVCFRVIIEVTDATNANFVLL